MTDAQRRAELKAIYKTPAWDKKVDGMHYKQVLAIYKRWVACGRVFERFHRKPRRCAISQHATVVYCCTACGEEYTRDNPELDECEFCGSKSFEREVIIYDTD